MKIDITSSNSGHLNISFLSLDNPLIPVRPMFFDFWEYSLYDKNQNNSIAFGCIYFLYHQTEGTQFFRLSVTKNRYFGGHLGFLLNTNCQNILTEMFYDKINKKYVIKYQVCC